MYLFQAILYNATYKATICMTFFWLPYAGQTEDDFCPPNLAKHMSQYFHNLRELELSGYKLDLTQLISIQNLGSDFVEDISPMLITKFQITAKEL